MNLILQSNVEYKNSNYNIAKYESSVAELEVDKPYTVTCCVTPAEGVKSFTLHKNRGNGVLVDLPVSGTKRQIISATYTCPSYHLEGNYAGFRPDIYRFPNDGSVTGESIIHWVKVESGTVTDPVWTPAPEDVVVRSELDALIKRVVALEAKAGTTSADSMELPSMDVMESGSETASADEATDGTEIN